MLIATANEGSEATYKNGFAKDKFPISHPNLSFSTLTVNNVSPEDSSLYLCSAGDTVLGTDQRAEQEPQLLLTQLPTNDPEHPAKMEWGKPLLLGGEQYLCVCEQA